jgi:hypothetical protein
MERESAKADLALFQPRFQPPGCAIRGPRDGRGSDDGVGPKIADLIALPISNTVLACAD